MLPPLLIVNPACGARATARSLPRILARVEEVLGDVVILYTSRRGHARELAQEAAREGYPLIIAVGGDGTFSEVANGVLPLADQSPLNGEARAGPAGPVAGGASAATSATAAGPVADQAAIVGTLSTETTNVPAVGLINVGTGGDFRRSLGIEAGVDQCLRALTSGRERMVDVGRASFLALDGRPVEQYFVNVLSAGLGGLVDRYIDRMPTFLGGRIGYYLAALGAVVVSKEQPLQARITWQGETREEMVPAYLVAICNGRWFGGGMDVAPMASPDDGRLEVVTVTAPSKLYLGDRVRGVYTGRHLEEPTVHHFPCERLELRLQEEAAERRFLLDVDGEALGSLPLRVEVVPRRLRVRG
jgi:diacylglycerol kinase (ATP)